MTTRLAGLAAAVTLALAGPGCGSDGGRDAMGGMSSIPPLTEDFGDYFLAFASSPTTAQAPGGNGTGSMAESMYGLYSNGARATFLVYPGTAAEPALPVRVVGNVVDEATIRIEGGQLDEPTDDTFLDDPLVPAGGVLVRDPDGRSMTSGTDGLRIGGAHPLRYQCRAELTSHGDPRMPMNDLRGPYATWGDEILAIGFGGIG